MNENIDIIDDDKISLKDGTIVYLNDIETFIDEFVNNPINDIENIYKLSQRRFNYILTNISKHFNLNDKTLKDKNSKHNAYNYNVLDILADKYIYITDKYSKVCTISGYCKMCGISYSGFKSALFDTDRLYTGAEVGSSRFNLYKKLQREMDASLDDKTLSGEVNAVYAIAVKNHTVWSDQQSDVNTGEIKQTPEQIAQKFAGALLPKKPE